MLSRRMLLPLLATAAGATACAGGAGSDNNQTEGSVLLPGSKTDNSHPGTLVVVFQRFAADWLNLLVPAGDSAYAGLRPTLKVTNPLMLDNYFGLHPLLSPLKAIYDAGDLAFVAATGWIPLDSRDRSHFYAQSIAESGSRNAVNGGWLSRVMNQDALYLNAPWAAIAAEASVPNSLQGYANSIALRDFASFSHGSIMGDAATALVEKLATVAGDPGATVMRLAQSIQSIAANPPPVSSTAYPATNLGQGLKVAAQAIHGGLAPRVITVTSDDDWDTHVSQANRHAASLPNFAGAIAAFHQDLGDLMQNVTLVTMTEFGRKASENFGGTDHGTGSSMLVMGKGVAGGRVYGQWPGLNDSALYQGQDLEPTTDFRAVLGEILVKQFGTAPSALDTVFPGGYAAQAGWRNFMR